MFADIFHSKYRMLEIDQKCNEIKKIGPGTTSTTKILKIIIDTENLCDTGHCSKRGRRLESDRLYVAMPDDLGTCSGIRKPLGPIILD